MNIYMIWKDTLTDEQFNALQACMSDGVSGRVGEGLYKIKALDEPFESSGVQQKHVGSLQSFLNWVLGQGNTHIMLCY